MRKLTQKERILKFLQKNKNPISLSLIAKSTNVDYHTTKRIINLLLLNKQITSTKIQTSKTTKNYYWWKNDTNTNS